MSEKKINALSTLIVIFVSLALSLFLIAVSSSSFSSALYGFFRGSLGSAYSFAEVLVKAIPLILCGLSVAVGAYAGFTNIGAEGQFYMGAVATTVVGMYLDLPGPLLMLVAFLFSFLLGGIWAAVPGILKARYGISEVITSLKAPDAYFPVSSYMPEDMWFFKIIQGTRLHAGLFLAILLAVVLYVIIYRTWLGFEIRAAGLNSRASFCSGINVSKSIVISSLLSGGFAAIAGYSEILGLQHRLLDGMSPGYGYLAIVASLLGRNNPFLIIFSSILIALIQVGSQGMQRSAGVPTAISNIILGLVVLLVLIRPFIKKLLEKVGA